MGNSKIRRNDDLAVDVSFSNFNEKTIDEKIYRGKEITEEILRDKKLLKSILKAKAQADKGDFVEWK